MEKLVTLINECVISKPKPAIYIGGGIDSAVILYYLKQKTNELIYSYTFAFSDEENTELEQAKKVADYFGTKHTEVVISNLLERYREILKIFPRPQFTLWLYWLAEKVKLDGRQTVYIGEGGDEHFGGYWYKKPKKSYVENWIELYQWGLPAYYTIHEHFGLQLQIPYLNLDWRETYPRYYDYEQHKRFFREAYKDVLPDFIVDHKKRPGGRNYWVLWENELHKYFPNASPTCEAEIRELWNQFATKMWLETHNQNE